MFDALAFATYMGVMSVTPGPNNLMLATSGVNHGFRGTLPHMLGISAGCALQLVLTVAGWAWLTRGLEQWRLPLAFAGCAYLMWLSWQLWRSAAPGAREAGRPLGFVGAVLFQWVNPKAWLMTVNAALVFAPGDGAGTLAMALLAAAVNLPCIAVWALFGDRLRTALQDARRLRRFNAAMALLLALTALWLLADAAG
ncbi:LysE family translocator [Crenobacter intestini]|uniref:LysE family translocator n=1 Tax=Crenobacter intestini TaxID=2563443 RepID=A0A4T0V3V3_9NEIS|nr:LysE family translocator [Crenobacter intestini]TIC86011.1 LysE family translocator [Crenobacter intestini]